jgi:hypothetical protein
MNDSNPTGFDRAPYEVTLSQVVERFATSLERCDILDGYIKHRAELHKMGLTVGFQWLDGSFSEDIEMLEQRAPRDIDVVTFTPADDSFLLGLTTEQIDLLGNQKKIKTDYKVDFYVQSLSDPVDTLVSMTTYWYSMWSHRRTGQWKGFVKVDLSPSLDADAIAVLNERQKELADEQI